MILLVPKIVSIGLDVAVLYASRADHASDQPGRIETIQRRHWCCCRNVGICIRNPTDFVSAGQPVGFDNDRDNRHRAVRRKIQRGRLKVAVGSVSETLTPPLTSPPGVGPLGKAIISRVDASRIHSTDWKLLVYCPSALKSKKTSGKMRKVADSNKNKQTTKRPNEFSLGLQDSKNGVRF